MSTTLPHTGAPTTDAWTPEADRALKSRHRAMWASGDFPALAHDIIPDLGSRLVEAAGVLPGQRVLDVAAGAGNASIPAARAGAEVVAADLTPELLDAGRRQAAELGLAIDWRTADAEDLPFADATFDVVLSCVGVMFAPRHRVAAAELVRVCRPGGTIALINWTPEGFIGRMFDTTKPYLPTPPPGALPPPLWGREDHIRDLFGDRMTAQRHTRHLLPVTHFTRPEDFRDYFKSRYGPTIAAYRGIADSPERVDALDRDLAELARRHTAPSPTGPVMQWEYLLTVARKGS